MRGIETRIQEIRHMIFTEVARMAYHTEWPVAKRIEELPYKIIPGERWACPTAAPVSTHRFRTTLRLPIGTRPITPRR